MSFGSKKANKIDSETQHPSGKGPCAAKKNDFERAICSDPDAKAEDAAMSKTYFTTYKQLDLEQKAALLADQRAWLKERLAENLSDNLEWFTPADQAIAYLSRRIDEIVSKFPVAGYSGEPDPLGAGNRLPVIDDPVAPFEGSWPSFIRARGYTTEVGDIYFQKGARVCGTSSTWFSGHVGNTGIVAKADGTTATILYMCKMDDTGEECATSSDGDLLWLRVSDQAMKVCNGKLESGPSEACTGKGVHKFGFHNDYVKERPDWISACLNKSDYPPPKTIVGDGE